MRRFLDAVLAVLLTLISSPPLPRVIRHNLHPFMKRCYGKVVAGGGAFPTLQAVGAAVVVLAVFAASAFALAHGHAPDPLLIAAAFAGSTVAVEQREELKAKQSVLMEVADLAGSDLDFSKKAILEKLGAKDATEATEKFQALNREAEVLGLQISREEMKAAVRQARERQGDFDRPVNSHIPGSRTDDQGRRKSWAQLFVESKQFKDSRHTQTTIPWSHDIDMKTLMETGAGFAPESVRSGVLVEAATRPIQVTDLIPSFPISQPSFVYMEETTRTHSAAEKAEGTAYAESAFVWTQRSSPVQKITDSIPVTDEQLEDASQVQSLLEQRLSFGLRQKLDSQILVGSGTPPALRGILNVVGIQTQAKGTDSTIVAFLKALTKIRFTGRANPTGAVFHPNDWQDVLLTQDAEGRFLFGNPFQSAGPTSLFGIPCAVSDAETENTAVVVDFVNFTRLDDRRGVSVQLGFVGDQFKEGKVTMRADMRAAFTVTRPTAVCTITGI